MRLQYPDTIRIVRVPCTGKVDVLHILRAFEKGADGIIVAGCEEGSCHFSEGNLIAKRRVNYTRELLAEIGLESERLRMINIGAADARHFVEILLDMVETVRKLGPNPIGSNSQDGIDRQNSVQA